MAEIWQEILMHTVKNRKEKFAIYPFGENGLQVKHFLNDVLGIVESMRIDRYYAQYTDYVIDVDTLQEINNYQKYIYIITSTKRNFSQELLIRGVPEENIVFCYPDGGHVIKLCAYYDAFYSLLNQVRPESVYDVDLLFGGQLGKSLYSGMECQEKLLDDIILYADKDKLINLFPAQKRKYAEADGNQPDMLLFTDNLKTELIKTINYKTIAVISKEPVLILETYKKCMYSYLYVYLLTENDVHDLAPIAADCTFN